MFESYFPDYSANMSVINLLYVFLGPEKGFSGKIVDQITALLYGVLQISKRFKMFHFFL